MMKLLFAVPAALMLACACGAAPAQQQGVVESMLPNADISASLTSLAAQAPALAPDTTRKVMPLRLIAPYWKNRPQAAPAAFGAAPYSALQSATPALAMQHVNTGGTLLNIDGIESDMTIAPSDPNGAVGETQYVQWVNTRWRCTTRQPAPCSSGRLPATRCSPASPARPAPTPAG